MTHMQMKVFPFVMLFYLSPVWIALLKKHPKVLWITLINVFLSWTVIGWIFALVWAIRGLKRDSFSF